MDYLMQIQDALSFIENNLTENITLSILAKRANLSAYYFHRLFQSFVGEPVMEYVRRKRLLSAADELLYSNNNILDIALKYRFNSRDVFGRAFKRLYGITPNEYRSINKRMANLRKNINTEEGIYMYDLIIGQKLQCTNIEKRECLETLNKLLEFSKITRKFGLLALEQEIEKTESLFMRKALMFITEGIDPANIRTVLQNYIVVGDYKGKALLERILIMEGVLLIQAGQNPIIIKEMLSSYFGEDFLPELMRYFNDHLTTDEKIKAYCEEIKENKPCFSEDSFVIEFENTMLGLDSRSLQRLLREMDIDVLINVMCGASGSLQMFFLDNVGKMVALTVINEVKERTPIGKEYLRRAQECILNIIAKLKEDGEIK